MSSAIKHSSNNGTDGSDNRFPAEVYAPCDDVTATAVSELREKAKPSIEGKKWKLVDGFGLSQSF
ncbi:MAG: hypothetical protein RIR97_1523 [Pseudomonadota bacterium]